MGADKVFDFTLGNPDLEPPPRFKEALVEAARDPRPGLHSYMTNAGSAGTRQALAGHLRNLSITWTSTPRTWSSPAAPPGP